MNIDSTKIQVSNTQKTTSNNNSSEQNKSEPGFADELQELKKSNSNNDSRDSKAKAEEHPENQETKAEKSDLSANAIEDLETIINELNQPEDITSKRFKYSINPADKDNTNKGEQLINNDFNIQDPKDKLPQMNSSMNFGGDGQPFSSFMKNQTSSVEEKKLALNTKDLEEEAAILSSMAENTAIANKMNSLNNVKNDESADKTVIKNDGIKRIDTQTGITKETIVKYDTVIMNQTDVEVFANLVENKEVNLNNLTSETAVKSMKVSKTLADLLAKAMENNKPIRIEFDNGISVIIKISRDGKLSADFLPSTQVAEAYLKENLPLLKQRFDDQNIEYDELNQRERRNNNKEQQRKKGSDNE